MDRELHLCFSRVFGRAQALTAQALFSLADWYIGEKRARELSLFAQRAMYERSREAAEKSMGTQYEIWFQQRLVDLVRKMDQTIMTWQDESLGPKTESGTPLSATGIGAKKRYEVYILSWADQLVSQLEAELQAKLEGTAKIEKPGLTIPGIATGIGEAGPTFGTALEETAYQAWGEPKEWESTWDWFEAGIQEARIELESKLPAGVLDKIDLEQIWSTVINETDMLQIRPSICSCTLANAAIIAIIKRYQHELDPGSVLDLYSSLLACIGKEDVGKPWWKWRGR